MKKNLASQSIGAQMITAADGTDFIGTVTAEVTVDSGTKTAGGGSVTHEGEGYHSYAPTQAETNGDHIAFSFAGTGAISATVQVYTAFPQTVDNNTILATLPVATDIVSAGAITTLTGAVVNVDLVDTLTTYTGNTPQTADHTAGIADIPTVAEFNARTLAAAAYFDPTADAVANVTLVATTTTNTDMVGTDNALLAADINLTAGAVDNVTLVATTTTNTDMRGTDSALLAASISLTGGAVDTVTDVTNQVTADATAIAGDATAATNLSKSATGIESGAAITGTLSTTQMTTNLTEATDDHYIGRVIIWTSGPLKNQATDITDYTGATKLLTYTATTESPVNTNTFVIV
jgi:hypothetical protein